MKKPPIKRSTPCISPLSVRPPTDMFYNWQCLINFDTLYGILTGIELYDDK